MTTEHATTYSIVHHQSGAEYIAKFVGSDVIAAFGPLDSREVATIDPTNAPDWIDNQVADTLEDTANDLNAWIEARQAWIARSPLDPNLR